jgi:ABC-type antimicrobial peptide transport system permease subunit
MDAQVKRSIVNRRLVTGLCAVFGLLATLLAMVGLYGVLAYSVTRRTREIGVRMALGARAPGVVWLILREAFGLVAVGVVIALPVSYWAGQYLQRERYGAGAHDVLTTLVAVAGLTCVAAIAGFAPAVRAARIDPLPALRLD